MLWDDPTPSELAAEVTKKACSATRMTLMIEKSTLNTASGSDHEAAPCNLYMLVKVTLAQNIKLNKVYILVEDTLAQNIKLNKVYILVEDTLSQNIKQSRVQTIVHNSLQISQ